MKLEPIENLSFVDFDGKIWRYLLNATESRRVRRPIFGMRNRINRTLPIISKI